MEGRNKCTSRNNAVTEKGEQLSDYLKNILSPFAIIDHHQPMRLQNPMAPSPAATPRGAPAHTTPNPMAGIASFAIARTSGVFVI
jgi:hypothetical protein